jgi:hypothetical protein
VNRVVLTMKWGRAFSPDYVNVLHSAVKQNLSGHFSFVCLTDDPDGLRSGIDVLPLPDIGLEPDEWYTSGVWPKLGLLNPDLAGLAGRALFLDLDTIILDSIDQFFERSGAIILQDMGPAWRKTPRLGPQEPGTCVFAFNIGEQSHVPAAFMADKALNKQRFANEQDFVAAHARDLHLWPDGWICSFKRHVARRWGRDILSNPARPSSGASIIAFHGKPRPADLLRSGFWGGFPHLGLGPVTWVKQYWDHHRAIDR